MIADGNHAFLSWVESFVRSTRCLVYFHVQRVVAVEKSTRHSVPRNLEPILLDTARRYHEYRATIHWKHESGWSVGIGWSISNRACTRLSASGSHGPPEGCVCIQAGVAGCPFRCCFFFICSQNSKKVNRHLIWVFWELVVLLNNLEEERNVDTSWSDCMINHELDQINQYFLIKF